MDIGCYMEHSQYSPAKLLEHAQRADAAGFDTVWSSDHLHPWWDTDGHGGSAWQWIPFALERTDDVRVGSGVTSPTCRYHPGLIAHAFATMGAIHPGRVHLALGTGEPLNELPLDHEWVPYGERRKRLIDACEIISQLWDGGFVEYDGHYWNVDGQKLYTLPEERIPLYVGADGPMSAEVAGRYADGIVTLTTPDHYQDELRPAIAKGAEKAGRDPADITVIRQLFISYDPDYQRALEGTKPWRAVIGGGMHAETGDPREFEAAGEDVSLDEMAENIFVTDDTAEIESTLTAHEDAGFDEVEFLSTSPDQTTFIDAIERDILGKF